VNSMVLLISDLLNQKTSLISALSEKFHLSLDGAREFLSLSIIQRARTNYKIQSSENSLVGTPELLTKLENDIHHWIIDDFDDEDFQIIGYCKNIR
jgi:hypothetical protein